MFLSPAYNQRLLDIFVASTFPPLYRFDANSFGAKLLDAKILG
jgi:hypothetical protein